LVTTPRATKHLALWSWVLDPVSWVMDLVEEEVVVVAAGRWWSTLSVVYRIFF
jgi:hypothetical protein